MSLLQQIQIRKRKAQLSKSARIYTLGEPYEETKHKEKEKETKKWKCDVVDKKNVKTYADPKRFKSLDDLCDKLKKFIDTHHSNIKKRKLDEEIELCKSKSYYITESCLYRCLERCLNEDSFYSREGLDFLIHNHFVTSVLHNVLVDCIIKHGDIDLLKHTASKINLKETLILKLLKYLIKSIPPEDVENIQQNVVSGKEKIYEKLTVILSLKLDVPVMTEPLKLLRVNEAAILLQLLRCVLFHKSPALLVESEYFPKENELTEKLVILWIDSLISAHMVSFSTSPISKPIIEELHSNIGNQINFYNVIGGLVPFMDALKNKYELPKRKIEDYSIEVLHL